MSIGSKVRQLREARGLSQFELARRSQLPQSSLSRIETDVVRDVKSRILSRLADVLDVSLEALTETAKNVRGPVRSDLVLRTRKAPTVAELLAAIQESLDVYGLTATEVSVNIYQEQTVGGCITAIDFKHKKGNAKEHDEPNVLDTVVAKALASPLDGCDRLACDLHAHGIRLSASAVRRRLMAVGLSTRQQRVGHLKKEADAGNIKLSDEQKAAMKKIAASTK